MERNGTIEVTPDYYENSAASGSLISFVFINDDGVVDFFQSAVVVLNRNSSTHRLHFRLSPRKNYKVFAYDVERDGKLSNGVDYPAVTMRYTTRGDGQGKLGHHS